MVFLISNIKVPKAKHLGPLWFRGDFVYSENSAKILEGHILKPEEFNINNLLYSDLKNEQLGMYNLIYYSLNKSNLIIKNDKLGKLPLYYFHKAGTVIISNNVWEILLHLDDKDKEIDYLWIGQFLKYKCTINIENTLFSNIKRDRVSKFGVKLVEQKSHSFLFDFSKIKKEKNYGQENRRRSKYYCQ